MKSWIGFFASLTVIPGVLLIIMALMTKNGDYVEEKKMRKWEVIAERPQLLRFQVEDGWLYKSDTSMIFVPFPEYTQNQIVSPEEEQDAFADAQKMLRDWNED